MYLDIMNIGLFDAVIINATLFMNMMSIDILMSIYLFFISGGISKLFTMVAYDVLLFLLTSRDHKLETKISSAAIMSYLFTRQFVS